MIPEYVWTEQTMKPNDDPQIYEPTYIWKKKINEKEMVIQSSGVKKNGQVLGGEISI